MRIVVISVGGKAIRSGSRYGLFSAGRDTRSRARNSRMAGNTPPVIRDRIAVGASVRADDVAGLLAGTADVHASEDGRDDRSRSPRLAGRGSVDGAMDDDVMGRPIGVARMGVPRKRGSGERDDGRGRPGHESGKTKRPERHGMNLHPRAQRKDLQPHLCPSTIPKQFSCG